MKICTGCDVMIPDHAHHCPHCRKRQRRGEWGLQLMLLAGALTAALAVFAEAC